MFSSLSIRTLALIALSESSRYASEMQMRPNLSLRTREVADLKVSDIA
jgi:hypothetical protein